MKRNKGKEGSGGKGRFFTSVLWKYLIFTIVFTAFLLFLFFAITWNAGKYQDIPHIKEVINAFDGKAPSEYDQIDVESILGENSYVQVLDKNHRAVYSSDKSHANEKYSDYEMSFIAEYNDFSLVTVEKYKNDKGKTERVITVLIYTDRGKVVKDAVYVVDEHRNILYSTEYKEKKTLTEREYQFLINHRVKDTGLSKSKCTFKDNQGKTHLLVVFSPITIKSTFDRIKTAFLSVALIFAGVYILMIILFSLWISIRVNKPLKILNHAMNDLSSGKKGSVVEYKGPREFTEICDNFNHMSAALAESEAENQKLQEEKQKMIADISHDLKTPVTVIKGYAKAVMDGLASPEEQKKYLATICQRSEELNQLIEEFHEYAKIDHPDNTFICRQTDICEFTRSYFAEKYNEFDLDDRKLDIDIPEEALFVSLDEKKFRRVYDNIVGNFFRYNPSGTAFFCRIEKVSGVGEAQNSEILITLADNGEGIPVDIRSRIFEPFIVGEKARNNSGSGLGLPIAKKIVEGHGGTINLTVLNKEGIGTEFQIHLPKQPLQ